ncbi:MAG: hypothetical protein GTO14_13100, partial [Anaerolineales bacterium]|nr:hypothetical protein [Anaerolineae bacterium]NIS81111.1 hypothetical protein [Anaerolineales bacterium]
GTNQVPGKIDGSLDFDGSDDYVDTNYNTHHTQTTIEAWIYPEGWGEGWDIYEMGRVIDKVEGGEQVLVLYLYNIDENLRFERVRDIHTGSWKTPNSSIALNTWQHIVVTYDESSTENVPSIYINGQPQSVTQMEQPEGTALTNTDDYIIGNRGAGDRTFDGLIEEVRISNVPRSGGWIFAQHKSMTD